MLSRKKIKWHRLSLVAGIVFLLLGVQLHLVESYVLGAAATRVLAEWTGPPTDTPKGAMRQLVVETTAPRKTITPPPWIGWASLSIGVILSAHGILGKWRRRQRK